MSDDDDLDRLRALLRAMLGEPEPEPENTGNVVPAEGKDPGTPGISDDQYARDFVNRVAGRIPMYGADLPEKD